MNVFGALAMGLVSTVTTPAILTTDRRDSKGTQEADRIGATGRAQEDSKGAANRNQGTNSRGKALMQTIEVIAMAVLPVFMMASIVWACVNRRRVHDLHESVRNLAYMIRAKLIRLLFFNLAGSARPVAGNGKCLFGVSACVPANRRHRGDRPLWSNPRIHELHYILCNQIRSGSFCGKKFKREKQTNDDRIGASTAKLEGASS